VDDQRLFELHLFVCAACRSELASYQRTANLLPFGLPPERPPAGARERLLAAARGEASESLTVAMPIVRDDEAPTEVGAPPAASEAPTAVHPISAPDEAPTIVESAAVPVEGGRRAELTVDGLPPLLPGRAYQLWFAEPGQPVRTGGAFRVDPRGDASVQVTIPTPMERVRAVAVTQEPAPGSGAPTGVHLLDWTP